ncbi:unnamed protein product, partial [Symbiodinium microadriaticum]
MKGQQLKIEADISSDLLLQYALERRGLALEQANIVAYDLHDMWVSKLFEARYREPPVNYSRVTQQQMIHADKQLFVKLAELTRGGIQLQGSSRPVDDVMVEAMNSTEVQHLLQPMPGSSQSSSSTYNPKGPGKGGFGLRRGGGGKSKGGRGNTGNVHMPKLLAHGVPNTTKGNPICFDHNLGKCTRPVKFNRCDRGLHICCMKGCFKTDHIYTSCPKKPSDELILETNSFVSSEQILELFDKLPKEEPNRGADGGGASFTTGAFSRVKSGLRANCARFPCLTRLLGRFVQQVDAGHVFTTIVIMDSVMTVPHRDAMNAPYPNMVVPLSKFEGGSIWVESGDGDVRRQFDGQMHTGIELPVATSAVKFDARRSKHLTCSWTGRRVVLIAFTTAGINSLVDADLKALRDMEFQVGYDVFPVDHAQNRFHPLAKVTIPINHMVSYLNREALVLACGEAPAGSKLLSSVHVSSESGARGDARSGDAGPFRISLGVYASEQEFTDAALGLDHPFDALDALDDDCKRMLFECAVKGPSWMCQHRAATLSKWLAWANELQADEEKLHDSMEPGVRHVLEGKRILLLERIARDLGWADVNLFEEIKEGFRLVGDMPHTGVFARELRPGGLSVEQFVSSFKYMRPALLGKVKSTKISEEHKELWQQTVDECSTGILEGPLSVDDAHERHGHAWVPVRRFGISQSSAGVRKLRAIDDFSEN